MTDSVIESRRLVFVGGVHRSGTTPLARMLSAHPEVSGFAHTGVKEDEGQHLQRVYPRARDFGGAGRFALDPRSHLTETSPLATRANARQLLDSWAPHWDLGRELLVEKSPPNLVMTRFLQELFPEARFLIVLRHPIVVALSTQKWAGPMTGLGALLEHWLQAHETFLEDAARLRQVQMVRYEGLIADPDVTMTDVAGFLGLRRTFETNTIDGRRSDAYVAAWRELTSSGSPLDRIKVARLRARYADRMEQFGYDFDDLGLLGDLPSLSRSARTSSVSATSKLPVLYVGGMPRSGSTLTDLMLHQLPGNVGVGELFYLWRNGLAHDGTCACGVAFSACRFWQEVGRVAFGGWDRVDPAHVMALQDSIDRTSKIPLLLSPWRPKRFAKQLAQYSEILRQLYAAILTVSGCRTVVDSSKRPSLAYILRTMPDIQLRVVHVVRDPRGVAFSFHKHVALPDGAALRNEMPRSTARKVARRWVTVNFLVGALARTGVPVMRVRYEALIAEPERELRRVLELAGEDATGTALSQITDDGITVPRTHVVAGGRIRLADGTIPLRLDEQWRQDLPTRSRRLVELMTLPVRRRYGYQ